MTTILIRKFRDANFLSALPAEMFFKVLHNTLPVWLHHTLPTTGARKKLSEALSIQSKLLKIEFDDETTFYEGNKIAYQIACEKKSDTLAQLLNPDNYK